MNWSHRYHIGGSSAERFWQAIKHEHNGMGPWICARGLPGWLLSVHGYLSPDLPLARRS